MEALLALMRDEIVDAQEELFDLYSNSFSSPGLGMIKSDCSQLDLTVAGRDFTITQSPGLLQSNRAGGTTGAAVWQTSVLLAEWFAWSENPLFTTGILTSESTVLELGSGVSGLLPTFLSQRCKKVTATDQDYILKILTANLEANSPSPGKVDAKSRSRAQKQRPQDDLKNQVDVFALDWESDDIKNVLKAHGLEKGVDCVVASDCIYNYALIDPFNSTCAEIAELIAEQDIDEEAQSPEKGTTVVVIAQPLRQPEVFEQWLEAFLKLFRTWRVPSDFYTDALRKDVGHVIHVGILRKNEAGS